MAELILHHYDASPFSEKVRRVLAFKELPWRAVEQPMWNPKPDLTPLTGGYRRIPVLQIGADIYCDTACILRVLEAHRPEPTIFPAEYAGAAELLAWWADRQLFQAVVGVVLGEIGHALPDEFRRDREQMAPGLKFDELARHAPHALAQFRAFCRALDRQLAGSAFVAGDRFSVADAACFHALWFSRMAPSAAPILDAHPAIQSWLARVEALGSVEQTPMPPAEALAIATTAQPATHYAVTPDDPSGLAAGTPVTVTPDDYAFDPVLGELAGLDAADITIRRHDPAVGDLAVHFPRAGFVLTRV